jgi:hypothetical protein
MTVRPPVWHRTVHAAALRRTAAIVVTLLLPAGAAAFAPNGAAASVPTFSGNLCAIVSSAQLQRAGITKGCVSVGPFADAVFSDGHSASWGTQAVIGGSDHYLDVSVYTPRSARYIPELLVSRSEQPRRQQIPGGILQIIRYHGSRGAEGFVFFAAGGLYCEMNLLDDPSTRDNVASVLRSVISRVRAALRQG